MMYRGYGYMHIIRLQQGVLPGARWAYRAYSILPCPVRWRLSPFPKPCRSRGCRALHAMRHPYKSALSRLPLPYVHTQALHLSSSMPEHSRRYCNGLPVDNTRNLLSILLFLSRAVYKPVPRRYHYTVCER